MGGALPALQRRVLDLVDEYDAKEAAAEQAVSAFGEAVAAINMAACVAGTYADPVVETYRNPDPKQIRRNLLKSAWKAAYSHLQVDRLASAKDRAGFQLSILAPLRTSIEVTMTGEATFIMTERGKPFTKESFGIWFKKACVTARVPGSSHGLRKAGARRAAEAGATDAQLNALFGWAPGSRESATYTRTADNARLARSAPVIPAPQSKVREFS